MPIDARQVAYADTAAADFASRGRGVATAELQALLLARQNPEAVSEGLAKAKAAGVSGLIIEEAEVFLLEARILPKTAAAPKAAKAASTLRCPACCLFFFKTSALDEHVCFGALDEDNEVMAAPADAPERASAGAAATDDETARREEPKGLLEAAEAEPEAEPANALGLLAGYGSCSDDDD